MASKPADYTALHPDENIAIATAVRLTALIPFMLAVYECLHCFYLFLFDKKYRYFSVSVKRIKYKISILIGNRVNAKFE
jgi:hypothetical protein